MVVRAGAQLPRLPGLSTATLAFAQWIHGINRGIMLPPGLDEQWLISVMHDDADSMRYADVFNEFVTDLTS